MPNMQMGEATDALFLAGAMELDLSIFTMETQTWTIQLTVPSQEDIDFDSSSLDLENDIIFKSRSRDNSIKPLPYFNLYKQHRSLVRSSSRREGFHERREGSAS